MVIHKCADGYLTVSEIPSYNLRSDFIFLSACDTGLGKVVQGEGILGIPFALYIAGNVDTIMTLWPIDDDSTAYKAWGIKWVPSFVIIDSDGIIRDYTTDLKAGSGIGV
jgi:hypothetical protein